MRRFKNVGFFLFFLCAIVLPYSPVFASGGSGGAVSIPRPNAADDFIPTKSLRGELVKISDSSLIIRDSKGREMTVALDSKTKFRAEDKAAFAGKTKLSANDFNEGASVRVLYREGDKTAVEIKVLKKKS